MDRLIKKTVLLLIVVLTVGKLNAQKGITPIEKIELQLNTHVFVVGEKLYYNLFCINETSKSLTNVSKIAHVVLVGENENVLFNHKHKLNNGKSSGDYFIPTKIKTGNYKMIAYTNLMGKKSLSFEVADVYIINQFSSKKGKINDEESIPLVLNSEIKGFHDKIFNKREEVSLSINTMIGDSDYGDYLVNVRRSENVRGYSKDEYIDFELSITADNEIFPEIRGELVTGKVVNKVNNTPLSNAVVSLSIPGDEFICKNVTTDNAGCFRFVVPENYNAEKMMIQVLDNQEEVIIKVDDISLKGVANLDFKKITLNESLKDWILEKSIYSQVENSYKSLKKDSILERKLTVPFYHTPDVKYVLNDYTRFSTIKETFTEVVQEARIRSNGDEHRFYVDYLEFNANDEIKPLLLLDGILIQDEREVVDFPANEVKEINLVKGLVFLGATKFNGIIDVRTISNLYKIGVRNDLGIAVVDTHMPEMDKLYYKESYKTNTKDRVPDFRTQLYWQPNFRYTKENDKISFYTSDVEGVYEIVIFGYNKYGQKRMATEYFEVK